MTFSPMAICAWQRPKASLHPLASSRKLRSGAALEAWPRAETEGPKVASLVV